MTPKEKAKELLNSFIKVTRVKMGQEDYLQIAKQCSLIAVDEILETLFFISEAYEERQFWQQVKQEIELL